MKKDPQLNVMDRLAAAARREQAPAIDIRHAVRRRIRQAESESSLPRFVIDLRLWLVASAVAAMTAVVVATMAASTVSSSTSGQSLASLTNVVEVSLQ